MFILAITIFTLKNIIYFFLFVKFHLFQKLDDEHMDEGTEVEDHTDKCEDSTYGGKHPIYGNVSMVVSIYKDQIVWLELGSHSRVP